MIKGFENRKCKTRNEKSMGINECQCLQHSNKKLIEWNVIHIGKIKHKFITNGRTQRFRGKSIILCVQLLTGIKKGIC